MKQLHILLFINNNNMDDLQSVSDLCKDGWVIIHFAQSNECVLPKHNTKVVLIKNMQN